jgi:hypothetical protein
MIGESVTILNHLTAIRKYSIAEIIIGTNECFVTMLPGAALGTASTFHVRNLHFDGSTGDHAVFY